jgi:kynurenine formamidase
VADNIGIDSGESAKGEDDKWTNSFYAHVRGLQRGWKFVENATNLGQLSLAKPDSCTLIVGAPKHIRGTGGPSRVLAMCEK